MTCIIGLIKEGVGYIAGDMCVSYGDSEKITTTSKVFNNNGVLIGCCGSLRVINCINNGMSLKSIVTTAEDVEDLAFGFVEELIRVGLKYKFIKSNDGELELPGNSDILLIWDSKIVMVGSDLSYIVLKDPYAAIGMPDHAEGMLAANYKKDPIKNISLAMEMAAKSNSGVSKEHTVLSEEQLYESY